MEHFNDLTIFSGILNFISMLGNVWFGIKLKKTQVDGQLTSYWRNEAEKKENIIQDMIKKKNHLKMQYENQLAMNKKLEGEIRTYKQFHNHTAI
jgi:hypothetical protein